MFIDQVKIYVKAGDGGRGCASFRREKFVPRGRPDGGDGGKGGDIIIEVDPRLYTLLDFYYRRHYKAEQGKQGGSNNKQGRRGKDLVIKVPPGTVVREDGNILSDLVNPGERAVVAKGGQGGKGNAKFATRAPRVSPHKVLRFPPEADRRSVCTLRGPRVAEEGFPGEDKHLELELKLIAEVGLVGYPNSGKSTLISRLSQAHPKIAPYPFTTLEPCLGIVKVNEFENFVLADIPGLLEGAHKGKGLGDKFLRHIERTKVLIHILDIRGYENRDLLTNFRAINKELELHKGELAAKPQLVAANKMDLEGAEEKFREFKKSLSPKYKVFPISALKGEGLEELVKAASQILKQAER
jgi:GTP-binding protein